MNRVRGLLCRACLALAAVLAVLLLLPLPLPLPRAPAPDPGRIPTPGLSLEVSRLQPDDVFIAVKTTRKNHSPRLRLLLRTWISRAPRQVRPRPRRVGPESRAGPPCPHFAPGLAPLPSPLVPGWPPCPHLWSRDGPPARTSGPGMDLPLLPSPSGPRLDPLPAPLVPG